MLIVDVALLNVIVVSSLTEKPKWSINNVFTRFRTNKNDENQTEIYCHFFFPHMELIFGGRR